MDEIIIHFIISSKETLYYIGEDTQGRSDSIVYIENPNYNKPIKYKKNKNKYIFNDKNAFIRVGAWVS